MKTTRELRAVATAATFSLIALAAPSAMADMISAESNKPMEGHDIKVTFTAANAPLFPVRYRAYTVGGEPNGGGWQRRDFPVTKGTVEWSAGSREAVRAFVVPTNSDHLCERDEEIRIVLDQPEWLPPPRSRPKGMEWLPPPPAPKWRSFCSNAEGWPCRFEATAYFSDDPRDCRPKQFGE